MNSRPDPLRSSNGPPARLREVNRQKRCNVQAHDRGGSQKHIPGSKEGPLDERRGFPLSSHGIRSDSRVRMKKKRGLKP